MKTMAVMTVAFSIWASVPAAPEAARDDVAQRLARFLDGAAAEGFTGVVLVARDGKVLLHAAHGVADPTSGARLKPDAVFTVGSITKQFTAAGILKLQEAGKLKVSDPITSFFKEVPEDKRGITLHHLLSHQAGFPGAIGDDPERVGRDEYVGRALATKLSFEPGASYEYSNVGFSLAAAVIEIVSGMPYENFLRERLFVPAGMIDTGYHLPGWKPERLAHGFTEEGGDWGTVVDRALSKGGPGWNLLGNGGIHSTAADMNRWHRALMGSSILSDASKRSMYSPHADEGGGTSYGYGWSVHDSRWGRVAEHNGGNRVFFADYVRYLDQDVVIYYATTSRDARMKRIAEPLAEIVFTDREPKLEAKPEPLIARGSGPPAPEGTPAARWGLPGTYQGQRAGELLDAIQGDADQRRAFLSTGFDPGLLERNGPERLIEMLGSLREEVGTLEVQGLRQRGASGVAIVIGTGRRPEPLQLVLQLEPDEPHRITRLEVLIGD